MERKKEPKGANKLTGYYFNSLCTVSIGLNMVQYHLYGNYVIKSNY